MADYIPSITVDEVIEALGLFLQPFAASAEIVRGQVNRTPPPSGSHIVLTEILRVPVEQPIVVITDITAPTRIDVQIDFYDPGAGDYVAAFAAAYRSQWAYDQFPATIKPAYCTDPMQAPFISGEHQWLTRWTCTASVLYAPLVKVPQQTADELSATIQTPVDIIEDIP